ncbi:MAG: hypothetical protein EXS09_06625 [Gemmataceae bacterium]|nr:hypothetical protein [Gemmataceae bacterium]
MTQRRRRPARSTVLSAVSVLVALNLGLAGFILKKPGLRDPMFDLPAEHFKSRVASAPDPKPLTIVFLGSSRTGYGIRPAVVEERVFAQTGRKCIAHNLHVPANGPIGQRVHWQRLLDRNIRPDIVVLEILPARFSGSDKLAEEMSAFRGDRMTWSEVELVRGYGFPEETEKDWREANMNPWFGFRFQLLAGLQPKWLPNTVTPHERRNEIDLGWKKPFFEKHLPEKYPAAIAGGKAVLFDKMQHSRFDDTAAICFRDLLQSCREHGTVPSAFVTPEGAAFREWYTPRTNEQIRGFVEELKSRGIIVEDGRAWLPDEAFSDGHHAVRTWADEYTRRVTEAVVIPAVRRRE